MPYFKRFLLLGSLGLTLLAGLMVTSATSGSRAALASGCNSTATGAWSNNCQTSQGNLSLFTVAIQTVVNFSGTSFNGHTCSTGTIDGDFGQNTVNGVKCFQGKHNLAQDGIVGPKTWTALENTLICNGVNFAVECHLPKNSALLFFENDNSHIWSVSFKTSSCTMVDNRLC